MEILLKPVNRDNWMTALTLKVLDSQQAFVPSVAVSLAKIYIKPDGDHVEYIPFAIYKEDQMVGFIMHAYEEGTSNMYWINGFLINASEQGKGYGAAALQAMITWIKNKFPQCNEIRLTVHVDNFIGRQFYTSRGFVTTGEWYGEEEVFKYDVVR